MTNAHGMKHPVHNDDPKQALRQEPTSEVGTIPLVQIAHSGSFKFVTIFSYYDEGFYIFGTPEWASHTGQFTAFLGGVKERGLIPIKFEARGGGIIEIDETAKEVRVGGYSEHYGRFEPDSVRALLTEYVSENLKGYTLTIT